MCGGVQEAGPLLAVEGGCRRCVGWAGGVQQKHPATATEQPCSSLAVLPGRCLWLLPQRMWKVPRAVPGAGKGLGHSIRSAGAE